jgi:hypothetical protein
LLERFRLGELNPAQKARVTAALRTDPLLGRRLDELTRSDQEILEKYPVAATARLLRSRATAAPAPHAAVKSSSTGNADTTGRHLPWLPLGMALSAAMLLAFFFLLMPQLFFAGRQTGPGYRDAANRIKGLTTGLHVYMQRGEQAVLLQNGSPARAQDVLQLGFVAAENYYAVILSLDGNGVVTVHLPENYQREHTAAAPFIKQQAQEMLLPYSYRLDAAPAFERFFLVTSNRSFTISDVLEAAQKLYQLGTKAAMQQPLPLPADFKQYFCLLIKESA